MALSIVILVISAVLLLVWNSTATEAMLIPAFIRNSGSP